MKPTSNISIGVSSRYVVVSCVESYLVLYVDYVLDMMNWDKTGD